MLEANTLRLENSLETSSDQVKRMIKGTIEALRLQGQEWAAALGRWPRPPNRLPAS